MEPRPKGWLAWKRLPAGTLETGSLLRTLQDSPARFTPVDSPVIAMLETIDGHYEVGPRKHLNQPVQKEFVIVRSGLEILFKDTLGFAHGFESQLPVGHAFPLVAFLAISARRSGAIDAAWAGSPSGATGAGLLSTGLGCCPVAMSIIDLAS
jgi:hypothetical protein